jgi:hypothetical protein
MSAYGKVISGGAKMSKGVTKGINDKLAGRSAEDGRRAKVATAVRDAFKVRHLSDQTTNNVSAGGKFQTVKERAKVQP